MIVRVDCVTIVTRTVITAIGVMARMLTSSIGNITLIDIYISRQLKQVVLPYVIAHCCITYLYNSVDLSLVDSQENKSN